MKYDSFGTLTLEVQSGTVEAENKREAVKKLMSTEGIAKTMVVVELHDGSVHTLKVHDHDIEWGDLEEIEIKKKATKQQLNDRKTITT